MKKFFSLILVFVFIILMFLSAGCGTREVVVVVAEPASSLPSCLFGIVLMVTIIITLISAYPSEFQLTCQLAPTVIALIIFIYFAVDCYGNKKK